MKPDLYLHIGQPKAASSTLQAFLYKNAREIGRQGYLIADRAMNFPARQRSAEPPTSLIKEKAAAADYDAFRPQFEMLHRRLSGRSRAHSAIISSENIYNPGAEKFFTGLSPDFHLHVILYIRRQDDWLVSAWKQWRVKKGASVIQYCRRAMENGRPANAETIDRWRPIADSLHVRPLHASALTGGSVVKDFAAAIGLQWDGLREPEPANQSIDVSLLTALRHSEFLFDDVHDNRIYRFLEKEGYGESTVSKFSILPNPLRQNIADHFWLENKAIADEFFPEADAEEIFGYRPNKKPYIGEDDPRHALRAVGLLLAMLEKEDHRRRQPLYRKLARRLRRLFS